jgi:hypothetical protein
MASVTSPGSPAGFVHELESPYVQWGYESLNQQLFAVGEWDICGDRFYAKNELYKMQWRDIKLDQLRFYNLIH